MKKKSFFADRTTRRDFMTYAIVIICFIALSLLASNKVLGRAQIGLLVPVCCWIVAALGLNLCVGVLGELSLGHAGFMSVGCFTGITVSEAVSNAIPDPTLRLIMAVIIGAVFAGIVGFLVGIPVLRLKGDYLAIVTLAFGEIIKDIVNCLIIGVDEKGLHIIFNASGTKSASDLGLAEGGKTIIQGAQGAVGTTTISTFLGGFVLVMIALIIVLNFVKSRSGRAVMAIRDNRIAAEASGVNVTRYKMIAFTLSAAIAGAAGVLYGLNFSSIVATKFNFNTSILILVYVVLGGLGKMQGTLIAATVLYVLPELLRAFSDYRMLVYAIVLIIVMITTNNQQMKNLFLKIIPKRKNKEVQ
ncbi:MAG: branched-chain amino acid ABC transporter permease [Parasporobacterium sp.]|nr:branched-chain amino acid ABC transporter permease [Parasporobacterium sp.]